MAFDTLFPLLLCTLGDTESVIKPKIVTDYNQHMSGVDIADQLMVYYACGRRTLKWYKRVFWRMVEAKPPCVDTEVQDGASLPADSCSHC